MVSNTSASKRETPHVNETTTLNSNDKSTNNISDAVRRRALSLINDRSIDPQSRAIIRYGLEINDPWLPELVQRVDAGEIIDDQTFTQLRGNDSGEEKVGALAEILCRAGDEPETKSAALLVLMATLENSSHPKALANAAKHLAFTRCGQLNLHNMVDTQAAALEDELLATIH